MFIGKTTDVCSQFVTASGYVDYSSEISAILRRFRDNATLIANGNWTILFRDPEDGRLWRDWYTYDERLGSRLSWVTKPEIAEWFSPEIASRESERVEQMVREISWDAIVSPSLEQPKGTQSEFFAIELIGGVICYRPEMAVQIRGIINGLNFVADHPSEPGRALYQSADYRCWDLRFPFRNEHALGAPRLTWISGDDARYHYGENRVSIFKKFL